MTFTGNITNINNALNGLSYLPTLNYNGTDSLNITSNDQGNFGLGVALITLNNLAITVTAVNDAPVNSVPAAQTTNDDVARVFSPGNSDRISVSDVDDSDQPSPALGDEVMQQTL